MNNHTETTTYTTNGARLQTAVGNRYTYDANGNTTRNGTLGFVYGDNNRLQQVHVLDSKLNAEKLAKATAPNGCQVIVNRLKQ